MKQSAVRSTFASPYGAGTVHPAATDFGRLHLIRREKRFCQPQWGVGWTRVGVLYFAVQGIGAAGWWLALLLSPGFRRFFLPVDAPDSVLLAFLLPDFLLFAGASLAVSYGLARDRSWTFPLLLLHLGASVYASLYCLNLTLLTSGEAWMSVALMLPATLVSSSLAWRLR